MYKIIRPKTHHQFHVVLGICLLVTLVRLVYNYVELYDLYADEAQYWAWSKQLAWGYYSKPPMIAWLIYSTTSWCGDSIFCIKLSSPFLHLLTSLTIYGISARLFRDYRIAAWSAITYITLPAVTLSASIISTDAPLLFFWALSMYFMIRGMQDWHINWWVLTGVAAGFGLLSKYNMILFFPSAALFFLLSKQNRVYLFSLKFWLAIAVAGLIYAPNFFWNSDHHFASYEHTRDNASIGGLTLYPKELAEFIGAQFGVFGPLLFTALLYLILFKLPRLLKKEENRFLLSFVAPTLGIILLVSVLSRAHANWAAPIYIAATILVVAWLMQTNKAAILYFSLALHLAATLVFYNLDNTVKALDITIDQHSDPFRRVRGWHQIGDKVAYYHQLFPDAQLLGNERKLVANLMYLLKTSDSEPANVYKWNADKTLHDHFDLTRDAITAPGKNFLLVTRSDDKEIAKIEAYFESAIMLGSAEVPLYPNYKLHYTIHYLRDFKGY